MGRHCTIETARAIALDATACELLRLKRCCDSGKLDGSARRHRLGIGLDPALK